MLLNFLKNQLLDSNSYVGQVFWKFLIHAMGDKTATFIGSVLSWVPAIAIDTTKLPPDWAPYINFALYVLGALGTIFSAYAATPQKAAKVASLINPTA